MTNIHQFKTDVILQGAEKFSALVIYKNLTNHQNGLENPPYITETLAESINNDNYIENWFPF